MSQTPDLWHRAAARLVMLDEELTHVLLIHGFDPHRPDERYWYTIGGGVDEGESPLQAVVREAWEEVGYIVEPDRVEGPLAPQVVDFSFDGMAIRQSQSFYVVVTPRFDAVFLGIDDVERDSTVRVEWVPVCGLRDLPEPVHPAHLAEIIDQWRASRA